MTYRRAKSQSKKETRHKYISFIRVLAKLKYVLLFFCRNQKLKACNEKRSGIIRETLSLKLQGCWGETKRALPKNKTRSLTYCYKKLAVSHQQTANISLSKHPILPLFQRCTKLHKSYHIDYLRIANNILYFCVFVFLCFCVLNFNCEMRRHR